MPVYNLFCMLRPTVGQGQLAGFMKKLGTAVFRNGGVLMDIRHHGLAKVRAGRPGAESASARPVGSARLAPRFCRPGRRLRT